MRHDILDQLRIDPGQRTLGQLLQDRDAAAHEIGRLRSEVDRLKERASRRANTVTPETGVADSRKPAFRAGVLIRIAEVCELLGISRSTVYRLLSEGAFPKAVRLGPGTIRWRIEAIEAWRDNHAADHGQY